jgi:hypothetical protein
VEEVGKVVGNIEDYTLLTFKKQVEGYSRKINLFQGTSQSESTTMLLKR